MLKISSETKFWGELSFRGQITPELIKLFFIFTKMEYGPSISFYLDDVDEEKDDFI